MHESVMSWVDAQVSALNLKSENTLEVGSFDVNGSVRQFFVGGYCGIDHADGPGVDLVMDACDLAWAIPTFGVVVSTEMLEHCERPWKAVAEMFRVLRSNGILLLTCRGFNQRGAFQFHNPPDNYRFSSDALIAICADAGFDDVIVSEDPQVPGWFVLARKG